MNYRVFENLAGWSSCDRRADSECKIRQQFFNDNRAEVSITIDGKEKLFFESRREVRRLKKGAEVSTPFHIRAKD